MKFYTVDDLINFEEHKRQLIEEKRLMAEMPKSFRIETRIDNI